MVDYVLYLMWLPILAMPFMVFWMRPQSPFAWRIGRLIAAVALLYIVLISVMYWRSTLEQEAYLMFMQQDPRYFRTEDAPKIMIKGMSIMGAMYIGWVPALIYVGFWELAWRIRHRKEIKARQRRDIGHTFSSVFIFVSILFFSLPYSFVIYKFGFFSAILGICAVLLVLSSVLMPEPIQNALRETGQELFKIIDQLQ